MTCHRILIVEDEPDIRETLKDILEMEGFKAMTAANGEEGLKRLGECREPCLILLDLMMPVMDGWRFLEILKQQHHHVLATIPIAVVSAASDVATVQQEYHCRIVKKPANIETILDLAHQYCEKAH